MFFVEICVFFLCIGLFCAWLLISDRMRTRKSRRESERIDRSIRLLAGRTIEELLDAYGTPYEQFAGSTGRSLYVWRRPPSLALPETNGVLVVTVTVDRDGVVADVSWEKRSELRP